MRSPPPRASRPSLADAAKSFPTGLEYRIIWNPTEFISESMGAVQETLLEAMLLVVLVIIVFLQSWRAAIIPIVAIPVSLIGTFAVLAGLGYSLNTLSMFGLVLAIGIVVDDAIVVVENVERNLEHGHVAKRGFAPVDGRSVGGAGRDRPGAVRGVRPDHLPHRHHRRILPPVRGNHRQLDDHLAAAVADFVAGACRAAAEAQERSPRGVRRDGRGPPWRRRFNERLRPPERMVRPLHPSDQPERRSARWRPMAGWSC